MILSHITCFSCDKQGHYANDCPDKRLKFQETVEKKDDETQAADELMVHEIVYLNERKVNPSIFESNHDTEKVWYLDNGASNHMCGERLFFYKLDESVTGKVRFGDDSRIDIRGKGSIRFVLGGGEKKILNNVYYIPGLRSRIRGSNEKQHADLAQQIWRSHGRDYTIGKSTLQGYFDRRSHPMPATNFKLGVIPVACSTRSHQHRNTEANDEERISH